MWLMFKDFTTVILSPANASTASWEVVNQSCRGERSATSLRQIDYGPSSSVEHNVVVFVVKC